MDQELIDSNAATPRFSLSGKSFNAKCVSVYDGDTAQFTLQMFDDTPVYRFTCRMVGYNSAEIRGATEEERVKAQESKAALVDKILNKIVTIRAGEFDKYGRLLVTVFIGNWNINEWMVANSFGIPYTGSGEKKWK